MSVRTLIILAGCAMALAACGKQGKLDRAPPLWGSPEQPPAPVSQPAKPAP